MASVYGSAADKLRAPSSYMSDARMKKINKAAGERIYGSAGRRKRSRTPEFARQKNENRLGMTVSFIAVVLLACVLAFNSRSLIEKEKAYAQREEELKTLIEQENARTAELLELETYTKTKMYAEQIAKDKLGLVYKNEIIFQEKNN